MTEDSNSNSNSTTEEEPELAPYKIEKARSGRSKCKGCRKSIAKDDLRMGILIEGPFGQGYIWHHLKCAAKRQWDALEEAIGGRHWEEGLDVPALDDLREHREEAERKKAEKKTIPYVEVAPSGRSKCKHSGEPIPKGSARVVLGRKVEFYGQTRTSPIQVLPQHVAEALRAEDSGTPVEGFADALRQNSEDVDPALIESVLAEIDDPEIG